jgi:acetolactate synthase-1/2/3 large subunit
MLVKTWIAQYLSKLKSEYIFGVSGANIEDLFSEISVQKKLRIILAKNEYNACTMAIGHYLASKEVAFVLTTSGAGVMNTLPILAEGFTSQIPFILISGAVPQSFEGQGAFQDTSGQGDSFDLSQVLSPVTARMWSVKHQEQVENALIGAYNVSRETKKPVAIIIPKNIFTEKINPKNFQTQNRSKSITPEEIKAQRPLIVLGEELVHYKKLDSLHDLIEKLDAKVATTPVAKGIYNHFSPRFLGLTGIMGHDQVLNYLKQTQDVILIGTKWDALSRFGLEEELKLKKIQRINGDELTSLLGEDA